MPLVSEDRILSFRVNEGDCPRIHEIRGRDFHTKRGIQSPRPHTLRHVPLDWQRLRLEWTQPLHESMNDWIFEVEVKIPARQ